MSEIVNLNKFRKLRDMKTKKAKAAVSRRRFGRTKEERAKEDGEREREAKKLEGLRLFCPDDDTES